MLSYFGSATLLLIQESKGRQCLRKYIKTYPKTWNNLGNYPFGIRSYLGNYTLGILSVLEIITWGKYIWENILLP